MNEAEDRFAIKRTATGLGLFTIQPIRSGKRIVEYTGAIVTREEADKSTRKYFMDIDEKRVIDGSPRSNIARYINHSCRPNAEALSSRGRVWIWSKKNIKSGEAITLHYGKEYFELIIKPKGCRCVHCAARLRSA